MTLKALTPLSLNIPPLSQWERGESLSWWVRVFVLFFLVVGLGSLVFAETVPGQIMVRFKPGVIETPRGISAADIGAFTIKKDSIKALNTRRKVKRMRKLYVDTLAIRPDWTQLDNQFVLTFPETERPDDVANDYKKDNNVISARAISKVKAFDTTPNDPYYASQYGLINIQAAKAWDRSTGEAATEIAVLDTGINYTHPDFTGKVDLTNGKDYVNHDDDPWDDHASAHGSAVSSVIAAATNNGEGVAGVDWRATILPIKVLDANGNGSMADILEGLVWATAHSVEAINMSFGQYSADSDLQQRLQEAYNAGIVLVAAAGNDNTSNPSYPAYYSTVIAVAAVDSTDKRSVWNAAQASNYGAWVDVAAAGTGIISISKNSSYANMSGTSLACPFVAGLSSLIKSVYPTLTNEAIAQRIKTTADNIDALNPGYEGRLGTGRINAYMAVAGVSANITSPESGSYISRMVNIYGTANGVNFSQYLLEGYVGGVFSSTIETSTTSVETGLLGAWDTTELNGSASIRLKAYAADSISSETAITVFLDNTTPEARITYPINGAAISNDVTVLGTANDRYLDYFTLQYIKDGSVSYQTISTGNSTVEAGVLGIWETEGLSGGYSLRLTVYDRAGAVSSESISITVQGSIAPTKEALPQPGYPLTYSAPNPFNRSATTETTFNYTLAGNFDTRIYLFDITGTLIWQGQYSAGENGGKAGVNNPSWNGRSLFGSSAAGGVYIYQVVADGRALARGKVIVLN
ncbi:MAG: S8 family serine peptidase [Candidatus Margulisbacteria bacterium]|nr:S8 family serine peptidase [Candidatus Margulisiibacteriota bacterium]